MTGLDIAIDFYKTNNRWPKFSESGGEALNQARCGRFKQMHVKLFEIDAKWQNKNHPDLTKAMKFYKANGRMPHANEPGGNFIRLARQGGYKQYHKRLAKLCKDWRDPQVSSGFPASLQALVDFYQEFGRLPVSPEPDYFTLKNARSGHNKAWHSKLDELIPNWRVKEKVMPNSVQSVIDFYNRKGRLPRPKEPGYEILCGMRRGSWAEWHDSLTAIVPNWKVKEERKSRRILSADEDIIKPNQRIGKWIDNARNDVIKKATREFRTITLRDGSSWSGYVTNYVTLGQGADFD